ncbi:MAG: NUDIX hydrolase [Rhodoplanes sp.]|uniref:NUDIX hydrolase n=1 Tax=Rhodoplanes sp. TaxID=1968906 RepID=UPI0017FFD411|nr:NUDIX hydrolase [Rhodoplanes sp.]NVO15739.1 NUDIX hydrolase [Rhodoplanes sp.]
MTSSALTVFPCERLDLTLETRAWRFADTRRAEIDAHFENLRRGLPHVWNGRVLLMREHALADGVLRGTFFETDFASFLAWRDWSFPDTGVTNAFAMGALRSSDGAFLLGEMAAGTANAGKVYFPCGTPDPSDVRDGMVDFAGSIFREVREETGLAPDDYDAGPWAMVPAGPRLAVIRVLQARLPADALCDNIRAHIAGETHPELAAIRVVRSPTDLDDTILDFVQAYLLHAWR